MSTKTAVDKNCLVSFNNAYGDHGGTRDCDQCRSIRHGRRPAYFG